MRSNNSSASTDTYAYRLKRGFILQLAIAIKSSLIVVFLSAVYNVWKYRADLIAEPLHFIYQLLTASWVVIPALLFSLVFTIGIPIAAILVSAKKWQIFIVILYQGTWLLLGLVSFFSGGCRNRAPKSM